MAWTYSDWRTYSGTAGRARLISHIQEVVDRLEGWLSQDAGDMGGRRFDLEKYLERLEKRLAELDASLGTGNTSKSAFTRGVAQ